MLNFLSTLLSPIFTPMGVSQADLTAYLNQLSGYVYAILFVIIAMIALMIGAHWAKREPAISSAGPPVSALWQR